MLDILLPTVLQFFLQHPPFFVVVFFDFAHICERECLIDDLCWELFA